MSVPATLPVHCQPEQHSLLPASEVAERAIPSQALLGGQASVAIDHQGVRYFLRATKAGKLILTK